MLSLGAVDVLDPSRSFYAELRPISDDFMPEALAVSGLDRERLKSEGEDPAEAMRRFAGWARSLGGRPVFCSFSTWDWVHVFWYLTTYLASREENPFGHSSLDMKSAIYGRFGLDWASTSKGGIKRGLPHLLAGAGPHTHNALDDAKEQAILFRRVLETAPR